VPRALPNPPREAVRRRPFLDDLAVGLTIFAIGLAKKVVLADSLALVASPVFDATAAGGLPGPIAAWAAVSAYALQIYFDFSAYSDMAIGLGRMFGIVLPINFASPYKAASIIEFWRRWHITLSRFLRDYLYIPLGGNRHGRGRQRLNLFLTMLLGGIWHGAGWTFVLWGALHGGMLILAHLWRDRFGRHRLPPLLAQAMTLLAVVLAWVPFRAADLPTTWRIYAGLFGFGAAPEAAMLPAVGAVPALLLLLAGWAIALLAPNTQTLMRGFGPGLASPGYATGLESLRPMNDGTAAAWRPSYAQAMALGLLLAVSILALGRASEFIYFQF
jgi:D-alanyl-lipoteichoic acid acyltransferase DltB (MBOAT superfamily)